jgi:allantoicase
MITIDAKARPPYGCLQRVRMTDFPYDRIPGGRVIACSDEGFAPAANLLAPRIPEFRFGVFIPGKGQEFDSWETRRHNPAPPDWVILALGAPGPIATVDIDTHWHDGNHAERGAVYALCANPEARPSRDDPRWVELLPPSPLEGHAHNVFRTPRGADTPWTHVLLENHPDGGIARLRCYAGAAPTAVDPGDDNVRRVRHEDPIPRAHDTIHKGPSPEAIAMHRAAIVPGTLVNLASEGLGARVVATSNNRYGPSQRLLADTPPLNMGDGWETSRSRGKDHVDHVVVALGCPGVIERIVVDFTYFVLNNPVALRILGAFVDGDTAPASTDWCTLVERCPVKHLAGGSFVAERSALAARGPFTHVKMESYPDGGANRLRVYGTPFPSR